MRYACLIYSDEKADSEATQDEMNAIFQGYMAFGEKWDSHIKGGDALMPTSSATTVRVRNGRKSSTDGPFAETKEQLGGFYIIEADDLDKAIEIASEIPGAARGSVEVRPVMEFD